MENNSTLKKEPEKKRLGVKIFRIMGMVLAGIAFAVLIAFVFGFVVQWLWNFLMPALFGLGEITYWQAFAIVILAKILFGGFGSHHKDHDHKSKWHWKGFQNGNWTPCELHKNAKYYKDFWRDEGKAAFEAYINRIKNQKNGNANE